MADGEDVHAYPRRFKEEKHPLQNLMFVTTINRGEMLISNNNVPNPYAKPVILSTLHL
jgi:hypothetical protein